MFLFIRLLCAESLVRFLTTFFTCTRKLCIREDGNQRVCIVGLQEYEISDMETVEKLVSRGNAARSKGSKGANEESSRSHSILQLAIKQNPVFPLNGTKRKSDSGELKAKNGEITGKISFIDLAGSEHGADHTHNDHGKRYALRNTSTSQNDHGYMYGLNLEVTLETPCKV